MFVESIELSHYRNIDSARVDFSPGINIFFGDNAQGKTNLLKQYICAGLPDPTGAAKTAN